MEGTIKRNGTRGLEVTLPMGGVVQHRDKQQHGERRGHERRLADCAYSQLSSSARKKRRRSSACAMESNKENTRYSSKENMHLGHHQHQRSGAAASTPPTYQRPQSSKRRSGETASRRSRRRQPQHLDKAQGVDATRWPAPAPMPARALAGETRVRAGERDHSYRGVSCSKWTSKKDRSGGEVCALVDYMAERKRHVMAARHTRKLELNACGMDSISSADLTQYQCVAAPSRPGDKSVELSMVNYSQSFKEDLPNKIFSRSVLEKLSVNSMSQHSQSASSHLVNVSSKTMSNNRSGLEVSCDKSLTASRMNFSNGAGEVLSNQASIQHLPALSGPNKAPSQGANYSSSSSSSAAAPNTASDLLNLSYISAITDLTMDPHEQASSLDLAASNVQLHSTFSYPLHSTFRVTEPSMILPNDTVLSAGAGQTSATSPASSQKDGSCSIGLNEAEVMSFSLAGDEDLPPARLSVTAVIRDTVKQAVRLNTTSASMLSSASAQSSLPSDKNNSSASSKQSVSMLSTRRPGDGSEDFDLDNGVLDLDSSCDSSTLSICVDDESFEGNAGDATYTGPAPDGNCDVCKIMKRQNATLNLKCGSDADFSDKDSSSDGSGDNALEVQPQADNGDCSTISSKLDSSHRKVLERCIEQAKAALRRYSPSQQYSPTKWVSPEEVPSQPRSRDASIRESSRMDVSSVKTSSESSSMESPKDNVSSLRRSQHRHVRQSSRADGSSNQSRESSQADGSSLCFKSSTNSVSMHSQDSGRGSSYFSDTVSMDASSSCQGNQLAAWHSTPFGQDQGDNRPVLRYNTGVTELKRDQGGIPFTLHVDPENCATPKPCKKIKASLEKGLRDSTGKYLNTPVSKSASKSRIQGGRKGSSGGSGSEGGENCDYDRRAIKKKLKKFCKNFQQENAFANLQSLGSV